jgi:DNA-binding protein HU-beta
MNKSELVSSIAKKAGLTKADAKKALDAMTESITETLQQGDKLSLVGFGTFSINQRAERQGKNPLTGQPITIKAKKIVKFKAGSELDSAVN